jgi:hypothetical protein
VGGPCSKTTNSNPPLPLKVEGWGGVRYGSFIVDISAQISAAQIYVPLSITRSGHQKLRISGFLTHFLSFFTMVSFPKERKTPPYKTCDNA